MADAQSSLSSEARGVQLALDEIVQDFAAPDGGAPVRVVDGVDLRFDAPGINMLLGPSGCGKSTLLRMMGGVRPFGVATPTKGTVKIGGVPCEGAHEDAVMVFQHYANRPDLTIAENVALPFEFALWRRKIDRATAKKRVDEMLESVGLQDKAELRPSQLS